MSVQRVNSRRSGKAGCSPVMLLTTVLDALLELTSPRSKRCSANDEHSQQRHVQLIHTRTVY